MIPLWDSLARRRRTVVTVGLVGTMLLCFLVQVVLAMFAPELLDRVLNEFALVPRVWRAQWSTWQGWLPVLSCVFLHGGWAHVAGNAWFLWVFGRSLEEHLGSVRFLLVFAVGAIGAGVVQIAAAPSSTVPMVGASGAISAVMGAYLVRLPLRWIVSLVPWIVPVLPVPACVFLILWFVIQFSQGLGSLGREMVGGVAWWAHAGGFVVGGALAMVMPPPAAAAARSRRRTKT